MRMHVHVSATPQAFSPHRKQWFLPLDYRPLYLSLIKWAVHRHSPALYQFWWGTRRVKPYTFALMIRKPQIAIHDQRIYTPASEATFLFTTTDPELFIAVYNGCMHLLQHPEAFPLNGWQITEVWVRPPQPIRTSTAIFQTLSPILIRDVNHPNRYVVPVGGIANNTQGDPSFPHAFHHAIHEQVKHLAPHLLPDTAHVHFTPIPNKARATLIQHFFKKLNGQPMKLPAFAGQFRLSAPPQLLNLFLQTGIGARRSQGFGMIELLQNPED